MRSAVSMPRSAWISTSSRSCSVSSSSLRLVKTPAMLPVSSREERDRPWLQALEPAELRRRLRRARGSAFCSTSCDGDLAGARSAPVRRDGRAGSAVSAAGVGGGISGGAGSASGGAARRDLRAAQAPASRAGSATADFCGRSRSSGCGGSPAAEPADSRRGSRRRLRRAIGGGLRLRRRGVSARRRRRPAQVGSTGAGCGSSALRRRKRPS